MYRITYTIAIIALILLVSSCTENQASKSGEEVIPVEKQPTHTEIRPTSTISDVEVATTPTSSEVAPPFEEIARNIYRITKRDQNPEGPATSLDGLTDPQIVEDFGNYNVFLRDKRVLGWEGWLTGCTAIHSDDPQTDYNLHVDMQEPSANPDAFGYVLLEEVDYTQLNNIVPSPEEPCFGPGPYPQIVFTGTIAGTLDNGVVIIQKVTSVQKK
jgi:hypothetical protein